MSAAAPSALRRLALGLILPCLALAFGAPASSAASSTLSRAAASGANAASAKHHRAKGHHRAELCQRRHGHRGCASINVKHRRGIRLQKPHGGIGASNPYLGGGCTAWAWANRSDLPGNLGNALTWGRNAARAGFPVDNTPQVGDIAVYQPGSWYAFYPYGHVAVVTAVLGGNRVQISEASYPYDTIIHTGRITGISGVQFIHHKGSPPPPPPSPSGGPPPPPPPPPPPFYVHHVVGTCAEGRCGLAERSGPGYTSYAQVGGVVDGQEIDIVCQTTGEPVTGRHATSAIWDKLTNGSYVTDYYTDTPGVGAFSPPIPRC